MENISSLIEKAPQVVRKEFEKYAMLQRLAHGYILSVEGGNCNYIPLVDSGTVRVFKIGNSGREISLYRILPGESCILTVSCVLSRKNFPAIAVVEKDAAIFLVPSHIFKDWLERFDFWKEYVFKLLNERLISILETVEEISFRRMDARIAAFLLNKIKDDRRIISVTHREIARELGSAREVISRILKDFERDRIISLSRGKIVILNTASLRRIL